MQLRSFCGIKRVGCIGCDAFRLKIVVARSMELSRGVTAMLLGTKCSKTAFAATNVYERSQVFISDKLESPTDDMSDQSPTVGGGYSNVLIKISTNNTSLTHFKVDDEHFIQHHDVVRNFMRSRWLLPLDPLWRVVQSRGRSGARRFFLASTAAKFRCDSQKRFDNTALACVLVHLKYVLLL